MKRVLIFIGLKIAEIIGVAVALVACNRVGWVLFRNVINTTDDPIEVVVLGYTTIGGLILVVAYWIFWIAIPAWIKANWEKAGEIARRENE